MNKPTILALLLTISGTWAQAAELDLPVQRPGYTRLSDWQDIQVIQAGQPTTKDVKAWVELWSKAGIENVTLKNLDLKNVPTTKPGAIAEGIFLVEMEYSVGGVKDMLTLQGRVISVLAKSGDLDLKILGYDDSYDSGMMIRTAWISERVPGGEDALFDTAVLDDHTMRWINDLAAPTLFRFITARKAEVINALTSRPVLPQLP